MPPEKTSEEIVLRLYFTEVKVFLTFNLNCERLLHLLAGACVAAGCGVGFGCEFGLTAALVLAVI